MSGANSYVPAITPESLFITPGYPAEKKKLSCFHGIGIALTLLLTLLVFVLSISAEIQYQKDVKGQQCAEGKDTRMAFKNRCMLGDCSQNRTPAGLIAASLVLTLVLAITSTVYGGCPCCCSPRIYAKNVSYGLSILFLVFLWLTFVVTQFFGLTELVTLALRDSDDLCIRMKKGQLVSVATLGAVIGLLGSAHIGTANLSRLKGPQSSANVPVGVPYVPQ
eukprot:TRINITY_DN652_c0_g1_i1.p1 TRINITY_DN652_c0_g1~~TRINITY_DN652_c0_g1_i1.p1  ORF type:complete len:221 (-),score=31.50 TRINITY_DN652_c0_g1_i1:26-688(-)